MKKYKKKIIFMSISFVLVFMTMIATTFAWIGIFTYANTKKFDINLRVLDYDADYFLTISSTGKRDSFSEEIDTIELKKQILSNKGKDVSMLTNDDAISLAYSDISKNIEPVTTLSDNNNSINHFKKMSPYNSDVIYDPVNGKHYLGFLDGKNDCIWFDLYFTVDTKEGISSMSEINSPIFMTTLEDTVIGNITSHTMLMYDSNSTHDFKTIDYNSIGTLPYLNYVPILKNIANSRKININAKNAIRFGFEIFEPIPIDEEYNDINIIKSNKIFSAGSKYPKYIENDDYYDLGDNLPTIYNTAAQELMNTRSFNFDVPDDVVNRGDISLDYEKGYNQVWTSATDLSSTSNYLGVHNGVQTKMRLRTYLWFEGWDADCLLGINNTDVVLNLTFAAAVDDKNE